MSLDDKLKLLDEWWWLHNLYENHSHNPQPGFLSRQTQQWGYQPFPMQLLTKIFGLFIYFKKVPEFVFSSNPPKLEELSCHNLKRKVYRCLFTVEIHGNLAMAIVCKTNQTSVQILGIQKESPNKPIEAMLFDYRCENSAAESKLTRNLKIDHEDEEFLKFAQSVKEGLEADQLNDQRAEIVQYSLEDDLPLPLCAIVSEYASD